VDREAGSCEKLRRATPQNRPALSYRPCRHWSGGRGRCVHHFRSHTPTKKSLTGGGEMANFLSATSCVSDSEFVAEEMNDIILSEDSLNVATPVADGPELHTDGLFVWTALCVPKTQLLCALFTPKKTCFSGVHSDVTCADVAALTEQRACSAVAEPQPIVCRWHL